MKPKINPQNILTAPPDKVFDNRYRLRIMSVLAVNKSYSFNELKDLLQLTDGNLASALKVLEESRYISVMKGFVGKKTNTIYSITQAGKTALKEYFDFMEQLIRETKQTTAE
ncbi:MAG: transcriptional regulator [Tannerellaceae bacterium]|jgi:DNA-binding MarR family transcriptional regulator|nr:transcriptional regulator [Tannerellaceae bacterium]